MNRAALLGRWDIDAETQARVSFDRAIALINLRRFEVAFLLMLVTDVLGLWTGGHRPMVVSLLIAAGGATLLAYRARRWSSLAAQQALIVAVFIGALLARIAGSATFSAPGTMNPGYQLALLTMTMLFVLRPRTLAAILVAMFAVYVVVVIDRVPGPRALTIVNAAIVSGIAQVAGWLIYSARRADFMQKRLIRIQNVRLIEQNQELDQLMAITAHDLRSPLYGLRNLLDLAIRRAPTDPDLAVRVMHDGVFSLDAMLALVTRLLDAHSAEHAALAAAVREDVRGPLAAAARRIAPAAEAAAIRLALDLPDAPLVATFERGALAHILDNLLSNAVRLSPAGGEIRLGCASDAGGVAISVADSGPGVDPSARDTLFGKFREGAKAGTGMGLFIAATFAGRMGASLSYRDNRPAGAIFTLAMPAG